MFTEGLSELPTVGQLAVHFSPDGKHVAYTKTLHEKVSNCLSTLLSTAGVTDPVGDSTATLPDLLK